VLIVVSRRRWVPVIGGAHFGLVWDADVEMCIKCSVGNTLNHYDVCSCSNANVVQIDYCIEVSSIVERGVHDMSDHAL
jgi:hypothetical protein